MDLRAYYGLNNYWEPIEDNYINAYPNTINMKKGKKKSFNYFSIFNKIYSYLLEFFNLLMRFLFSERKKRNRDYYFDKLINE